MTLFFYPTRLLALLCALLLAPIVAHAQELPMNLLPHGLRGTMPLPFYQMPGPEDGTNEFWDGGFGLPGLNSTVYTVATANDGSVYVGGDFTSAAGAPANGVAMWNGTNWTGLGTGYVNGIVGRAEAIVTDGSKVYVGGEFGSAAGKRVRNVAMWDKATGEWSDLGGGVGGLSLNSITSMVMVDGELYVAGRFIAAGTTVAVNIARWDGRRWHRVGEGVNGYVHNMTTDGSNLFIVGEFTVAGREPANGFARYDIAAGRWHGLELGVDLRYERIASIAVDDEYVYIGGKFRKVAGVTVNNIARWNRSTGQWSDMLGGVLLLRDTLDAGVEAIAVRGEEIIVGGNFSSLVSDPLNLETQENEPRGLLKWNTRTETWSMLPRTSAATRRTYRSSGVFSHAPVLDPANDQRRNDYQGSIHAIAVQPNGDLILGGHFMLAGPATVIPDVAVGASFIGPDPEAVVAHNIVRLSGKDTVWSAFGGGLDNEIAVMERSGDHLYVGGRFLKIGRTVLNRVARIDLRTGAWEQLGSGVNGIVQAFAVNGDNVYVGGSFTQAGGAPAPSFARWNTATRTWSTVGSQEFTNVTAIAAEGNSVYVGGAHGIARWNGGAWSDLGGIAGTVNALALHAGKLYVGGSFTRAGSVTTANFAVWDIAGQRWEAIGDVGGAGTPQVNAIEIWEGKIYVGGLFTSAGGLAVRNLAMWDPTARTWSELGYGVSGTINTLAVGRYGLYVGGSFWTIEQFISANNVGLWTGTEWHSLGTGVMAGDGRGIVKALADGGDVLYLGGTFRYAGGITSYYFAEWNYPPDGWIERDRDGDGDDTRSTASIGMEEAAPDGSSLFEDDKSNGAFAADENPDDAYWRTFMSRGADDEIFALEVDSDGETLYVGGAFDSITGLAGNGIMAWTEQTKWKVVGDGSGVGPDGIIFDMDIEGDNVYVVGQFTSAGGRPANNVAVLNKSTGEWSALGAGLEGETLSFGSSIAVRGSSVYVGGTFSSAGAVPTQNIAMWDGSSWRSLGAGIDGSVEDITFWKDELYAGGSFSTAGTVSAASIARWDGSAWKAVGQGVSGYVNDLEPSGDSLLMIGEFTVGTGRNLAFWNGQEVVATGGYVTGGTPRVLRATSNGFYIGGVFSATFPRENVEPSGGTRNIALRTYRPLAWNNLDAGVDGPVNDIAIMNIGGITHAVAAGAFVGTGLENEPINYIAKWSELERKWSSMEERIYGTLKAMAVVDGKAYAAGTFQERPRGAYDNVSRMAVLDNARWQTQGGAVLGDVITLSSFGDDIYAGGSFLSADDDITVNVARWNVPSTGWSAITPGSGVASLEEGSLVRAVITDGSTLYLGGNFTIADTHAALYVARWQSASGAWSPLGAGFNAPVWALAYDETSGKLYAGGDFTVSGLLAVSHVAVWDGTSWQPLGSGLRGRVSALAVDNGTVYAGGRFALSAGTDTVNVARFDAENRRWDALGSGLRSQGAEAINALAFHDGVLYAGGSFDVSGQDSLSNVARWDGSRWEPLGSGVNNPVSAIIPDGDSLFVGGAFTCAGRKQTLFVAVWKVPPTSAPERPTAGSLFNLGQNVPNPANDATSIPFSFSGSRLPVRLTLVDIHGVVVGELMDRVMEPGSYRVEVETGALPSGTYFYRLSCAGQTIVKPMTVRR